MDKSGIGYHSIRMFIWSLAYRIMCIVVSTSLIAIFNNKFGVIMTQIFCLGIILVLPYLRIYDIGFNDHNRINYGHIKRDRLKGLKIGLIVSVPYVFCSVALILARFSIVPPIYLSAFRMINSPYFSLCQTLLPPTLTITEQSLVAVIMVGLTAFTEPVVYGLGYRMGLARISFTEQMGLRKPREK